MAKNAGKTVTVLLVACCYYLSGLVGLTVAIQPGYASMVWPAAGIALGLTYVIGWRALPGVWLGSFWANLWVADVVHALVPATGALAQAAVGALLMHRFLRKGWIWDPSQLFRFFLICAAASAVNGLWSPIVLELRPFVAQARTWWAGDVIGSFFFAPLIVFLDYEKGEHEREHEA